MTAAPFAILPRDAEKEDHGTQQGGGRGEGVKAKNDGTGPNCFRPARSHPLAVLPDGENFYRSRTAANATLVRVYAIRLR